MRFLDGDGLRKLWTDLKNRLGRKYEKPAKGVPIDHLEQWIADVISRFELVDPRFLMTTNTQQQVDGQKIFTDAKLIAHASNDVFYDVGNTLMVLIGMLPTVIEVPRGTNYRITNDDFCDYTEIDIIGNCSIHLNAGPSTIYDGQRFKFIVDEDHIGTTRFFWVYGFNGGERLLGGAWGAVTEFDVYAETDFGNRPVLIRATPGTIGASS